MKNLFRSILLVVCGVIFFTSCDSSVVKPTITGTPYEVLVVAENDVWESAAGKAVFNMLNANMPSIPQNESMFKISHVNAANFTHTINTARNILLVEVSDKYSKAKITYRKNVWAKPQSVIQITAPAPDDVVATLTEKHQNIYDYYVKAEYARQNNYYDKYYNIDNSKLAAEMFGLKIKLPANQIRTNTGENFFWSSNMSPDVRQDIVIYSFPYTNAQTFNTEYLLAKRDSVMKAHIPGPTQGSYMATEYRVEPTFRAMSKDNKYCAEVRGWWRVEGDLMGGPFVSLAQVDERIGEVLVMEAFVYAPGMPKRSFLRQLESVLYNAKIDY